MEPEKWRNKDIANAKQALNEGYVPPLRRAVSEDPIHSSEHKKTRRISGGADPAVDRSPFHQRPHSKSISHVSTTPSRGGRQKPTVDTGSTVPKLFEWDENDPSSADNYTGIFEKVREERKHGLKPPMISHEPELDIQQSRAKTSSDSGCSCFSWFRK